MILLQQYFGDQGAVFYNYLFYIYLALCYLYGSIPFGLVIGKFLYGIDIRSKGSKNIGATNATRILGKKAGFYTLLLDSSKSALAAMIGWWLFPDGYTAALCGGLIAVFAHTMSIFLKFKGGKGVATFFGVLLVLDWRIFLAAALSWILVFLVSKNSGLAAILTFLILPITIYLYYHNEVFWLLLFFCIYIISLHRQNIEKLLANPSNNQR